MIRICDFEMDGIKLKVASMSYSMAQKFVEESRILLARTDVSPEEWSAREHQVVLDGLKRGGNYEITLQTIAEEFDIPTLNAIYLLILEKSGLRATGVPQGEAEAASTSVNSVAA